MDDCTESQEVEQCSSDMARCGEMYAQKEDEDFFGESMLILYCKDGYNEERDYTAVK